MNQFTTKYGSSIQGVLSGFDRLVFRGTLRALASVKGMLGYLSCCQLHLEDFGAHAKQITDRLKSASLAAFEQAGRPILYLPSAQTSKEDLARQIAKREGITEGPVCALTSVEPCHSFDISGRKGSCYPRLERRWRKCLYLYHYMIHPVWGFINARIQTWFPFAMQVCINGREWLARQMDAEGIGYVRQDNCFVFIQDYQRAQSLQQAQLQIDWAALLDEIAKQLNPLHEQIFDTFVTRYYWSCHQSEWATDLVFSNASLQRLYPRWVAHGMTNLSSPDILRFLGQRLNLNGEISAHFHGQVKTDLKCRAEGVRIKHRLNHNAIKAYDKAHTTEGSVLRIETTLNDPADFKVYRPKEGGEQEEMAWRPLRHGVADMHRRAQVCQKANERYLQALSSADDSQTLQELTEKIVRPTTFRGKQVRALNPLAAADAALLSAVSRGEFAINGLRNRDLQRLLFRTPAASAEECKRRSAWVTRQLRLLRAHSLIVKVPHTHRYHVTDAGRAILTAILTARQTPVNQLLAKAA